MKPWRERIAEARERGGFSVDDYEAFAEPRMCFVGEMRERFGLRFNFEMTGIGGFPLGPLQTDISMAIITNNFDAAERLLDEVEDRALQIKREAGS